MIAPDVLHELIKYNPETGEFFWNKSRRGVRSGQKTGCVNAHGYVVIGLLKKTYLAHRLAWLYMTRVWPTETVDHRNGRRADNRWENLRQATYGLNNANTGIRPNNTTGCTGVSYDSSRDRWRAYLSLDGKRVELGKHRTLEAAAAARVRAEAKYFGEYRHQSA